MVKRHSATWYGLLKCVHVGEEAQSGRQTSSRSLSTPFTEADSPTEHRAYRLWLVYLDPWLWRSQVCLPGAGITSSLHPAWEFHFTYLVVPPTPAPRGFFSNEWDLWSSGNCYKC